MKILIGTPIHQVKDYCMERWLKNVSELLKVTRAYLLLVDNSPGNKYIEKVKLYLSEYNIKNYKIVHLDLRQDLGTHHLIDTSHEFIRHYTLSNNYDAWFSWECDQIIPTDALNRLTDIMKSGDYSLVLANSWARADAEVLNTDMGVTLINKSCLLKNSILRKRPKKLGPENMDNWQGADYKRKVLKNGGRFIELYGVIQPIYHLNN